MSATIRFDEALSRASSGDAYYQFEVAVAYLKGEGTAPDTQAAAEWLERAAVQGHVSAQHNLASLYLHGDGVPQDKDTAMKWYRAAARSAFTPSICVLADLLQSGTPQDKSEAAFLCVLAAGLGDGDAQLWVARELVFQGSVFLRYNPQLGLDVLRDAANNQVSLAQFLLGQLYEEGRLVPHHLPTAVFSYWLAEANGCQEAAQRLTILLPCLLPEEVNQAKELLEAYTQELFQCDSGTIRDPDNWSQVQLERQRTLSHDLRAHEVLIEYSVPPWLKEVQS